MFSSICCNRAKYISLIKTMADRIIRIVISLELCRGNDNTTRGGLGYAIWYTPSKQTLRPCSVSLVVIKYLTCYKSISHRFYQITPLFQAIKKKSYVQKLL